MKPKPVGGGGPAEAFAGKSAPSPEKYVAAPVAVKPSWLHRHPFREGPTLPCGA